MARSRIGGSSAPIHAQPATVAEAGASLNNRPTRITRSQSREPAPTNVGPAFNQRATHGHSASLAVNDGIALGRLNDINEDASEHDFAVNGRQHSIVSTGLSVTNTARTTFSQDDAAEVRELDRDMVIDSFATLLPRADDVLNFVFSQMKLDSDMNFFDIVNSREYKILGKRVQDYIGQRGHFSSHHYIRPDLVLRALLKVGANAKFLSEPWRPDDIVFRANLAGLIGHISQCNDIVQQAEVLQALDSDFPRHFMISLENSEDASGQVGECLLKEETHLLALHLRTQLAVNFLALDADEEHRETAEARIAQVFLREGYEHADQLPDKMDVTMLRGFDVVGAGDLPSFQEHVIERIKDLKAAFDESEDYVSAIEHLQENYAWPEFRLRLLDWVELRSKELSANIINRGGASNLAESTERIVSRLTRKMAKIDPRVAQIHGDRINRTPRASGISGAASIAKPMMHNQNTTSASGKSQANVSTPGLVNNVNDATTRSQTTVSHLTPPIQHDDDEDDESDGFEIPPNNSIPIREAPQPTSPSTNSTHQVNARAEEPGEVRSVGSTLAKMLKPALSRKEVPRPTERRFIDRQADAEKIQFSQASQPRFRLPGQRVEPRSSPPGSPVTSALGKRVRQETVDIDDVMDNQQTQEEPSQDGGFQGDTHSNVVAQRHVSVPDSSPSLPRTSEQAAHVPSPPKRPRQNPGQSIDTPAEILNGRDAADATSGQRAKLINIQNRIANRALPSKVQSRRPWSERETSHLIDEIGKHGISWSLLMDMDINGLNIFQGRNQTSLRDKARNLKVDYELARHRNGTELPANLDQVPLGQKERAILEKHGVEYYHESIRETYR